MSSGSAEPLPYLPRPEQPLPAPSDWTFDLIERYHNTISQTAERFGLDTYPNQLEIITAEQMMDAYASVGMPLTGRGDDGAEADVGAVGGVDEPPLVERAGLGVDARGGLLLSAVLGGHIEPGADDGVPGGALRHWRVGPA